MKNLTAAGHEVVAVEAIRDALLAWYATHRRDLPWRRAPGDARYPDPYRILVAEFMLQQTRMDTALPYYARWMARFPDVSTLAEADLEDVMRLWQGLGYYGRARRLHEAARRIRDDHSGTVPADPAALRALPGIGPYTAGAILSTAFGLPEPAIDGNAIRLITRVWGIDGLVTTAAVRRRIDGAARTLIGQADASSVNQAVMELAALVCTPRWPRCGDCPVERMCVARRDGAEERLPVTQTGAPPREQAATVFLVEESESGKVLVGRRAPGGLLPDLWAFPMVLHVGLSSRPGSDGAATGAATGAAARMLAEAFGVLVAEPVGAADELTHVLTHMRMVCKPFQARVQSASAPAPHPDYVEWRWMTRNEVAQAPMSRLMRKLGSTLESS